MTFATYSNVQHSVCRIPNRIDDVDVYDVEIIQVDVSYRKNDVSA